MKRIVIAVAIMILFSSSSHGMTKKAFMASAEAYVKAAQASRDAALHPCNELVGDISDVKASQDLAVVSMEPPYWPRKGPFPVCQSGFLLIEIALNSQGIPLCSHVVNRTIENPAVEQAIADSFEHWLFSTPRDHRGNPEPCYCYVVAEISCGKNGRPRVSFTRL